MSVLLSVLDNKNGSPYLFYQRQFWSCVKVCAGGDAALGSDHLPVVYFVYFCSQLLGNILMWDGILSISCLKDLALDSTLNRYILSALQTTDTGEENIQKCQKVGNVRANMFDSSGLRCWRGAESKHGFSRLFQVVECLPALWFSGLKGQQTLPQLEPLCRYLAHLAKSLHRSSLGTSDLERRATK